MYYQGIGHAFRTICREEGFWGLYKGLGATMLVRFLLLFLCSLVSYAKCVCLLTASRVHLLSDSGCWTNPCNQLCYV